MLVSMAGYSGTPLPKKLGIKASSRVTLLDAPEGFEEQLDGLPDCGNIAHRFGRSKVDVIVWFVTKRAALERRFANCSKRLVANGGLWVAWPKRASGVSTDVSENAVREVALAAGLVDNKVCAIDDIWSGLRCVIRVKDRAGR